MEPSEERTRKLPGRARRSAGTWLSRRGAFVLGLAFVLSVLSAGRARSAEILWEEHVDKRVKIKVEDGRILGTWEFPRSRPLPGLPQAVGQRVDEGANSLMSGDVERGKKELREAWRLSRGKRWGPAFLIEVSPLAIGLAVGATSSDDVAFLDALFDAARESFDEQSLSTLTFQLMAGAARGQIRAEQAIAIRHFEATAPLFEAYPEAAEFVDLVRARFALAFVSQGRFSEGCEQGLRVLEAMAESGGCLTSDWILALGATGVGCRTPRSWRRLDGYSSRCPLAGLAKVPGLERSDRVEVHAGLFAFRLWQPRLVAGRPGEALVLLERERQHLVSEASEALPEPLTCLEGTALAELGWEGEARATLARCLEADTGSERPDLLGDAGPAAVLAELQLRHGDVEAAREHARGALEAFARVGQAWGELPSDADPEEPALERVANLYALAKISREFGAHRSADRWLLRALDRAPPTPSRIQQLRIGRESARRRDDRAAAGRFAAALEAIR